jgi:ABC-type glutathione transport system ATPase component
VSEAVSEAVSDTAAGAVSQAVSQAAADTVSDTVAEPYLVLDGLKKSYPRPGQAPLRVLDGLDVAVEEGALLSILGPSGCGKSTLLNIINEEPGDVVADVAGMQAVQTVQGRGDRLRLPPSGPEPKAWSLEPAQ